MKLVFWQLPHQIYRYSNQQFLETISFNMPAIAPLLVREVHGVLAKRAVDHTVIEAVVVSKLFGYLSTSALTLPSVLPLLAIDCLWGANNYLVMVCVFVLGGGIYWLRKKYDWKKRRVSDMKVLGKEKELTWYEQTHDISHCTPKDLSASALKIPKKPSIHISGIMLFTRRRNRRGTG